MRRQNVFASSVFGGVVGALLGVTLWGALPDVLPWDPFVSNVILFVIVVPACALLGVYVGITYKDHAPNAASAPSSARERSVLRGPPPTAVVIQREAELREAGGLERHPAAPPLRVRAQPWASSAPREAGSLAPLRDAGTEKQAQDETNGTRRAAGIIVGGVLGVVAGLMVWFILMSTIPGDESTGILMYFLGFPAAVIGGLVLGIAFSYSAGWGGGEVTPQWGSWRRPG